jgi:cellobiose phosphorylase
MRYGNFDDVAREYVIGRPDTPLPWINYLGCEAYFGIVSQTGGGYSFYRDARLRRITRYRYNNVPPDTGGRYVYLRDASSGEYWSPTWQPTQSRLDEFTCRHGLGYTTIESLRSGVRARLRYLVPLGESLEIWQLVLTNHRSTVLELDVYGSVEFCLWDANDDATNFQRNYSTGEVEVERQDRTAVIYHKTEYRERRDHFAYFATSEPVVGFETQRESFLGPYRGWDRPVAVERGRCEDSVAHGWSPVGVLQSRISLPPGASRTLVYVLGYHENQRDAKFDPPGTQTLNKRSVLPVIARHTVPAAADEAFTALRKFWDDLLAAYQVHSPDVHVDRMVNIWNAYQCMVTFNLSRSASLYESGVGRGLGFRDSNQDLCGFVHMVPERARERILDLAATQLQDGGAFHQYQPLTKRGNHDVGSGFNDDPLWLIVGTAAYLKETGDWGILDERVPYENTPGTETPLEEHLERSLRYTEERLGPHALPLIGRADWNDCLNLNCFSDTPGQSFQTTTSRDGKVAESVFIAGLYVLAADELAEIAGRRGRADAARACRERAQTMAATVREHGWDGDWFLRAYDDRGDKVGSKECTEGKIFIETQGMCVMAGIGLEDGSARRALDSVAQHLATPHGILLQQPAYRSYHLHLGEISSYPPGYKENAGIFCHNNPWVVIAETRVGNGDRAGDYYLRINPSAREAISEVHRCEPYVYAQMIAGRDAPTHGEAKNSWLTGTASWNYVAITQWILGIRPAYDGLIVEPVLPQGWPEVEVQRRFRGVRYRIRIRRSGRGNTVTLRVGSTPQPGTRVPLAAPGVEEVVVEATLS